MSDLRELLATTNGICLGHFGANIPTDQSNLFCHPQHIATLPLLGSHTLRAGGFLTSKASCDPAPCSLRCLFLWGLEETRSLNHDPRKRRIKSRLLCWSCSPHPQAPSGNPLGSRCSTADNWIRQQNRADEYPRGPAWNRGSLF